MILNNKKPKRGAVFTHTETGQQLYLNRIVSSTDYLMCEEETQALTDTYINVDPKLLKPAKNALISTIAASAKPKAQKNEFKAHLNVFFASQILTMPDRCECCGKPLNASNKFFKRCVSAHILPKSEFPSVAIHPKNLMFLGAGIIGVCFCHDDWDGKGADNRTKMFCYDLAVTRFHDFVQLLTPHELIKACTYLSIPWPQQKQKQLMEKGETNGGIFGHLESYRIKVISGANSGIETTAIWDDVKQHFEDAEECDCTFKLDEVQVLDLA